MPSLCMYKRGSREIKGKKLTMEVLDEQFLRRLKKEGLITLKELFIDSSPAPSSLFTSW